MSSSAAEGYPEAARGGALAESEEIFKLHAEFCRIFSTPNRLRILWLLADGERTVSEIAERVEISVQNASQHLRLMRDRGAVKHRRDGNTIRYRIGNAKFLAGARLIREGLVEHLSERGRLGGQRR